MTELHHFHKIHQSKRNIESQSSSRVTPAFSTYMSVTRHPSLRSSSLKDFMVKQVVPRITDGLFKVKTDGMTATLRSWVFLPWHKRIRLVCDRDYRSPAVLRPR